MNYGRLNSLNASFDWKITDLYKCTSINSSDAYRKAWKTSHTEFFINVQMECSVLSKREVFPLPQILTKAHVDLLLLSAVKKVFAAAVRNAPLQPDVGNCSVLESLCDVLKPKQIKSTGGKCEGQVKGHVEFCTQHHQQHVLRDSEACRPNLKLFPEGPPAASITGIRLPTRTSTKTLWQSGPFRCHGVCAYINLLIVNVQWLQELVSFHLIDINEITLYLQ